MTQKFFDESSFIRFASFRERLVFLAVRQLLFAIRFNRHDCEEAASWAIVLFRVLRYQGTDGQLEKHEFLGAIGREFSPDRRER